MEDILYFIGLLLVITYIVIGIDDCLWDSITLIKRCKKRENVIKVDKIDEKPPKLIAMVIAAWKEDNVLMEVIDNVIESQQYPKSMYHIFLGVYPNDDKTIAVAKYLEQKYANVHCVINKKAGPTSKAQNINYVIDVIRGYEEEKNYRFATITVHDSEDIVHPYELKVTNYIIDDYKAVQFPVFPLIKKPNLFNYFQNITTNTYADEFAENHYITMVSRKNTKAFVPSAGTGFSISRDVIDKLGYEVLPEESLTEDYRLALSLYEQGLQMYYVLEKLERVDTSGKIRKEFIATRSMFPNTFKTAVRQKTRWTLGITMQSNRFFDIFKKKIPFAGKYTLYRDQKAKITNLISGIAYPVFIYFVISLIFDVPAMYPKYSISWYISFVVTAMMLERQIFRGVALYNVYGVHSVFWGCFFPPLMPLRIIWGNTINFVSTVRAYFQFFKGKKKVVEKTEIETKVEELEEKVEKEIVFDWSKTEHSFLDTNILKRFHRKIGDIAVTKGYISVKELKEILENKMKNEFLGKQLYDSGKITEEQWIEMVTIVEKTVFLKESSLEFYNLRQFSKKYKRKFLEENKILPIMQTGDDIIFAVSDLVGKSSLDKLNISSIPKNQLVLASEKTIVKGIELMFARGEKTSDSFCELETEQIVLIKNYASEMKQNERKIASDMGFEIEKTTT